MAATYMDVESEQHPPSKQGLLAEIWASKVYHLWIVVTLYILCKS